MMKEHIDLQGKTIFITGAAGFIASSLIVRLIRDGECLSIIGMDSMNAYYDIELKKYRLHCIEKIAEKATVLWKFIKGSIADEMIVDNVFSEYHPDIVVNLAAQAGVRYSIDHPRAYIESNVIGFFNIIEACRHSYDGGTDGVLHLVYASSSSVYGMNGKIPYSTKDKADSPVSLYAATKKSDELMAHAYAKLYNIPSTGLRFFTVYGSAGRPDMAYFKFADRMINNDDIEIYNYGNCKRDFTYIDDIIEGIVRVIHGAPMRGRGIDDLPTPPYALYNIGNGHPINLLDFVKILSEELMRAELLPSDFDFNTHMKLIPMQAGDVAITYADTLDLEKDYGYCPKTSLTIGLRKFIEWYKNYYHK